MTSFTECYNNITLIVRLYAFMFGNNSEKMFRFVPKFVLAPQKLKIS